MRVNRKTSKELTVKNCSHVFLDTGHTILNAGKAIFHRRHTIVETVAQIDHVVLQAFHTIVETVAQIVHVVLQAFHTIVEIVETVAQIVHVVLQAIHTIMNGPDFLDLLILTSSYLSNLMSCITVSVRRQ